jgi:hypothetical protein
MKKSLTDYEIKVLLSKEVLNLKDKSKECILRGIIFTLSKDLDWKEVYKFMINYMPELAK